MRLIAVLALMVLIALPAYAETDNTVVGNLLGVEGPVLLATADAEHMPLKLNAPIHMNDVIETGAGARAFILLIDNTELTLGENAQLTIDDYVFDEENTAANKGRYSILRGAFLYTSGLIAKKENPDVTVNTPYGAIGIRGTTFWGGEIDDEYGILVTEGRVSVENGRGRLFVSKGQGTTLTSKTSIPSRANVWPAEKIDRAVQTIALKDTDGVRKLVGEQGEFQKENRLKLKEFLQERQERLKQENVPGTRTKRIDNAPRPVEKTEVAPQRIVPKPATLKPVEKPGVLDEAAPEPVKTEADILNKPFKEETKKAPGSVVEPLLKAPATNAAPVPDKGAAAQPPASPAVTLPDMGNGQPQELENAKPVQQPVRQRPLIQENKSKAESAL